MGATYSVDAAGGVASVGFSSPDGYTVIMQSGGNTTVGRGVYSSWECLAGKPGEPPTGMLGQVPGPGGKAAPTRAPAPCGWGAPSTCALLLPCLMPVQATTRPC